MKNRILPFLLLAALTPALLAAKAKPASRMKAANATEAAPSRELNFDGASVNGRYHSAGEAVARVEGDKAMNMLIGARRDFRDRLAIERERLEKSEKK